MKIKFLPAVLISLLLIAPHETSAQVPTHDAKEYAVSVADLGQSIDDLQKTTKDTKESLLSLIDLGPLLDYIFDMSFLIPQDNSQVSSEVKATLAPKQTTSASASAAGVTGQVGSLLSSAAGDLFGGRETVVSAVKDRYQTQTDDSTTTEIATKQKDLGQSKQSFARYSLAAGLVNRTLAYRTLSDAKQKTEEKTKNANTIRDAHTSKTYAQSAMAETYNRMLFAQAVANGLDAFKAMKSMEGHVSISLPGLEEATNAGGLAGKAGELAGKLSF